MYSIIFFGSDQYSAIVLETVLSSPLRSTLYDQISIVTDRPKPVGKGLAITPSPVEILAKTHNLDISYYPSNTDEMIKFISLLKSWFVDTFPLGLCASFDHLLPQNIIEIFAGNLYNLHPSLLPQYRNVSPVQYAIALGDTVTGITLFRITTGIDNGEIIAQTEEAILPTDTTPTLTPRLFQKGADLFLQRSVLCNNDSSYKERIFVNHSAPLIFTHRLTRDSGFIEWPVLSKLLANQPIHPNDTKNKLLSLRLERTLLKRNSRLQAEEASSSADERRVLEGTHILSDLLRSLTPWPTVWSLVPTKKGHLRISLESVVPDIRLKIAGKPKPISLADFKKYYL